MTKARAKEMDAAAYKAGILKALAHPVRIRLFEALVDGEKTAGDLVRITGEKDANTSRHLSVLKAAGLVKTRKDGLNVYYSNAVPCLVQALGCVSQAVCNIAEEHMKIAAAIRKG
jgi:ArsR family transcriptional regulator